MHDLKQFRSAVESWKSTMYSGTMAGYDRVGDDYINQCRANMVEADRLLALIDSDHGCSNPDKPCLHPSHVVGFEVTNEVLDAAISAQDRWWGTDSNFPKNPKDYNHTAMERGGMAAALCAALSIKQPKHVMSVCLVTDERPPHFAAVEVQTYEGYTPKIGDKLYLVR